MSYKAESLHPYIMNNKISVLSSQNETQTQDIIDIKGSLNSINDNLSGFKFYPTGTAIVGLVSDDSAYTDSDGNYIIASSTTGQSMIDNVTYKSINSTEDCRGEVGADTATPFRVDFVPLTTSYITINGEMTIIPSQNLNKFKYIVVKYGWSGDTLSEDVYSLDTVSTSGMIQIFRKSDLTSYRAFSWSPTNGTGYYAVKIKIDSGNFVLSTTNNDLTKVKLFGL